MHMLSYDVMGLKLQIMKLACEKKHVVSWPVLDMDLTFSCVDVECYPICVLEQYSSFAPVVVKTYYIFC